MYNHAQHFGGGQRIGSLDVPTYFACIMFLPTVLLERIEASLRSFHATFIAANDSVF
jgi:hypothetical protein